MLAAATAPLAAAAATAPLAAAAATAPAAALGDDVITTRGVYPWGRAALKNGVMGCIRCKTSPGQAPVCTKCHYVSSVSHTIKLEQSLEAERRMKDEAGWTRRWTQRSAECQDRCPQGPA
jgi:hypothetical protein